MLGKNLIEAAAGNAGGGGLGIEDVFSTWLYTGNGSTQTITNGIDLAGEGGLVWIKDRDVANFHILVDTERGTGRALYTNATSEQSVVQSSVTAFNSDGFDLGSLGPVQDNGDDFASWTFRKAPGFFDVVTYTGNGVQGRAINHSLGSAPGCIIVKCTSAAYGWTVYHRSTGKDAYLVLSSTGASTTDNLRWNSTDPTSSQFTVGNAVSVNESGQTYVAYLFAHDEPIFGESGDQSVIKCGSFTVDSLNRIQPVNLGFEPQFLILKMSSANSGWFVYDTMRGLPTKGGGPLVNLRPDLNFSEATESTTNNTVSITSDGFTQGAGYGPLNASSTGIYIAIRRGPMKTPESGTEVFLPSVTARNTEYTVGFPPDMAISKARLTTDPNWVGDRLRGNYSTLKTETLAAEDTAYLSWTFDATTGRWKDLKSSNPIQYLFRRAPGFFDVVAYNGNSNTAQNVSHNLGVQPELMIFKTRSGGINGWYVYHKDEGVTKYVRLQTNASSTTSANWLNNTAPTSSVFSLGTYEANWTTYPHIAYLFATCPGVSKVGSYTGTGTTLNVDCGFTSGARFVLIKRTDSTGDWYVWDTARGIVSGNDPYLLLNSTAAEVTSTDYIDPLSSGFQISSTAPAAINASGGSYIFLAIA